MLVIIHSEYKSGDTLLASLQSTNDYDTGISTLFDGKEAFAAC